MKQVLIAANPVQLLHGADPATCGAHYEFEFHWLTSVAALQAWLAAPSAVATSCHLVIDAELAEFAQLQNILAAAVQRSPPLATILLLAPTQEELILPALRAGVHECLIKTADWIARLGSVLSSAEARCVALQSPRRAFERFFELSIEMMCVADLQGHFTLVNEAFCQTLGYSQSELLARPYLEFVHSDDIEATLAEGHRLASGGEPRRFENRYRAADGSYKNISWISVSVVAENAIYAVAHDVTAYKLVEQALRASEERFRHLVESSYDLIWSIDREGNFTYLNQAARTIYGYEPEEIIGRNYSDFCPPEQIEADRATAAATLAAGRERVEVESTIVRRDGSLGMVKANCIQLRDANGAFCGWTGTSQDITQRKRDEASLRASEERFKFAALSASDVLWDWDAHANKLWWSDGFVKLFGFDAAEIGEGIEPWFRQIHPDDQTRIQHLVEGVIANGENAWSGEFRFRRHDGTYAYVLDRGYVIRDSAHQLVRMVGGMTDLTARREQEIALQESEARFRQLVDNIEDVFWIRDIASGHLLYVSPAFERIWQLPIAQVLTDPESRFNTIHPDDQAKMAAAAARTDGSYDEQFRIQRPDGTERWIHGRAFVVRNQAGEPQRVCGVARDITERRFLEQQLRQSQKMDAFGQLAGGVAHDFNNLLLIVSGYSELLLATLPEDDTKRTMLASILDASQRATALTRQLLAFSRQQFLEPKVVDLNEIVMDAERLLRRLIGEEYALSIRLWPTPLSVRVDPGQMDQVIINLALNARDAMPQGGQLQIETRLLVTPDSADLSAVLAVSDTGCGIPPESQARIFEPFYTTKPVGKGTGLGLAVVHGIVQQSGGQIQVQSVLGVGTRFEMLLPILSSTTNQVVDGAKIVHCAGTERILLVEDEPAVRQLAAMALENYGYQVITAENGKEALRLIQEDALNLDLLITDVVMPEMGGRKLAESLRTSHPHLKVLYVSGYTDDAVVRHGVLEAEVAMLQKPFTPSQLGSKVREVLDQRVP